MALKMKVKVYASESVLDKVQEALSGSAYKFKRETGKIKAKLRGSIAGLGKVSEKVLAVAPAAQVKFDE